VIGLALAAGVVLAAVAVLLVALPFLREPSTGRRPPRCAHRRPGGDAHARRAARRALSALKELEFDHRTGKITDDDYRRELGRCDRRRRLL